MRSICYQMEMSDIYSSYQISNGVTPDYPMSVRTGLLGDNDARPALSIKVTDGVGHDNFKKFFAMLCPLKTQPPGQGRKIELPPEVFKEAQETFLGEATRWKITGVSVRQDGVYFELHDFAVQLRKQAKDYIWNEDDIDVLRFRLGWDNIEAVSNFPIEITINEYSTRKRKVKRCYVIEFRVLRSRDRGIACPPDDPGDKIIGFAADVHEYSKNRLRCDIQITQDDGRMTARVTEYKY